MGKSATPPPALPYPGVSRRTWKIVGRGIVIVVEVFILLVIIGNLLPSSPNQSRLSTLAATPAKPAQPNPNNSTQATDQELNGDQPFRDLMTCLTSRAQIDNMTLATEDGEMGIIAECRADSERFYQVCTAHFGPSAEQKCIAKNDSPSGEAWCIENFSAGAGGEKCNRSLFLMAEDAINSNKPTQ